jgi:hypothetical protein
MEKTNAVGANYEPPRYPLNRLGDMNLWLAGCCDRLYDMAGAAIDAEMEHQTVRDTTAGRPKPLGQRGAKMPDTVGPAQD